MPSGTTEYEVKREALPALGLALLVLAALALASWFEDWQLLHRVHWWVWFALAVPEAVLILDLLFGAGLAGSRRVALFLLGSLVTFNAVGLAILIAGLVTTSVEDLGGGELLLTAAALWTTNTIVFGLWFWEIDDGGPVARATKRRVTPDFQFPQDENPGLASAGWSPQVWDYVYVSVTNSIAFSPTDALPLTRKAKALMGLGSMLSVMAILLVGARAVNILGT
jgi:hypothetical protein